MPIALGPDELHLWTLPCNGENEHFAKACWEILPETEQRSAEKLKFEEQRKQRTIAQAGLRIILAQYLDESPPEIRMTRAAKGKPQLKGSNGIRFNMSHSDGLAAYGIARDQEVGVDLERIRPLEDLEEMIRSNFSPAEIEAIQKEQGGPKESFFRFWTFKEAYLKAIGEGMRIAPEKLEFRLQEDRAELVSAPEPFEGDRPIMKEFRPTAGSVGTLSYRKANTKVSEWAMNEEEILEFVQAQKDGSEKDL